MDIYTEIILDHYKNPQNYGTIKTPTVSATEHNPVCGDKVRIDVLFDEENKIKKIKFSGEGCAISQAATSMLTEKLIGKTSQQIKRFKNENIYKMLKIPISSSRIKCALLGLTAIKTAATQYNIDHKINDYKNTHIHTHNEPTTNKKSP